MNRTSGFAGRQCRVYEIGDGSLGPTVADIHCAAAEELGLELTYVPRKVERGGLPSTYRELCATADGFTVAAPFKTEVLMLLDAIDDDARSIGACNLVVRERDGLKGFNTDWISIFEVLKRRGLRPIKNGALVVGTGAAARAALYALWRLGFTQMKLAGKNGVRARSIGRGLGFIMGVDLTAVEYPQGLGTLGLGSVDVVVNATPLGKNGEDPLLGASLPDSLVVVDLALSSEETPLVRRAGGSGRLVVTGTEVAKEAAALDVRIWAEWQP
jgi:shikimate dehydrogenase